MTAQPENAERAGLVQVNFCAPASSGELEEFYKLAYSAGADVRCTESIFRAQPEAKYLIGEGKVQELAARVAEHHLELLLFNTQLSPSQERNLEKALQCRVLDRSGLVLDIFARRARSYEGKLQVELAQLQHLSTRLVRGWTHLERQKGGIGLRGPGESQLETDRRLLGVRMKQLRRKLDKVRQQREQNRRGRATRPLVALAGYTNSGKSTLFNRLTGAQVYARDQLFATLDPTWRRLVYEGRREIILTDTVGFVSDLPHELIEAFHATLQESAEADLLLHVIDYHDPERLHHQEVVEEVLQQIHADKIPRIIVWNKIDLCDEDPRLLRADTDGAVRAVWLSAQSGAGVELLIAAIVDFFQHSRLQGWLELSPTQGEIRAAFYNEQAVLEEYYDSEGQLFLHLDIEERCLQRLKSQYNRDFVLSPSPENR